MTSSISKRTIMATKKLTGKEARYILKQHRVNLADLAQRLGIAPQSLNSRLNAETFSTSRQIEVNTALGMQVFEIETPISDRLPVLDIRASAGMGIGLEGDEHTITEYISVPRMTGCVGITVYGDIMLSNITARLIDEYLHHLRTQHLSPSYINISIAPIRTLVNYAVKMQYVRYDINPFAYYHQQDSQPRDLDISVEDMRKLFAFRPAMRKTRKTLDIFLLSYLLGGMNFADLINYDFSNRTEISYIRQKTKLRNTRPTVFSIPPEALPIIDRLADKKTGRIALGYTGDYHSMLACVNNSLKTIARQAGLTCKRISFYSARKSFIQHGFDIGTPLEILEYCSGQTMKSNRPIFNYVKIMRRHADVAIRNVIDNIINPPTSSQTQEGKTNDI